MYLLYTVIIHQYAYMGLRQPSIFLIRFSITAVLNNIKLNNHSISVTREAM